MLFVRIKRGDVVALVRRQQSWQNGAAEGVEIGADRVPIVFADAPFDGVSSAAFRAALVLAGIA